MYKAIVVIFLLFILTAGCIETEVKEEESEIYPTFDVKGNSNSDSPYNSYTSFDNEEGKFTVPIISYTNSHIIRSSDCTAWYDPRIEFDIRLNLKAGVTTKDRETIYFSVQNLDERVDGLYRLLTKADGWYRAVWKYGSETTWYEEGSLTIGGLGSYTLTLDLDVNQVGASYIDPMEGITLPIVFSNVDNTWSEMYNITFMMVGTRDL